MRASLGVRMGPLYVGTGNLLKSRGRSRRRRGPNLWTWLLLYPFILMWLVCKYGSLLLWQGSAWAWRTGNRALSNRRSLKR